MVSTSTIGDSTHARSDAGPMASGATTEREPNAARTVDKALGSYGDALVRLRGRMAPTSADRASVALIVIGALTLVMAFVFRLDAIGVGAISGNEFITTLIAGTVLVCVGAGVGLYAYVLEAGVIAAVNDAARDVGVEALRAVGRSVESTASADRPPTGRSDDAS